MTTSEPLVFLSCGGTIEKIYLAESGQLGFDRSRISDWLKTCRIAQPWRAETLMLIDSLEMNDTHRLELAKKIAATAETRIVVIHGTDTMVESAKVVMTHRQPHQTVVFTGAMVPASLETSDAFFNLGLATGAAQQSDPGVYIAMSGEIFAADRVRKNRDKGIFESTASDSASTNDGNGTLRITKRKMTGFFR
ncbi:MAG: asparaginase [Burkholderiaceae bacterium]|nr:asparaginase [Burkholderiaceae bacterium]